MIRIPPEILTALETVLDYNWQDEERHYYETPKAERHNHIFQSLRIMQSFVNSPDTVAVQEFSPPATLYEVQTEMLSGWENCWTDENGERITFASRNEAEQAMKDHIIDCVNAVEAGDMVDSPDPASLRVVEVQP